jgi:hypothetical protein
MSRKILRNSANSFRGPFDRQEGVNVRQALSSAVRSSKLLEASVVAAPGDRNPRKRIRFKVRGRITAVGGSFLGQATTELQTIKDIYVYPAVARRQAGVMPRCHAV